MICYKDMTFCGFLECADKKCHRRLTKEVKSKSIAIGLPICQFMDKPNCFK
uniref:Uncharacterized protein n=1 Tax=viral metagenome TaxID=1070528 RepID=A0A6M3KTF3_9ZZZZ